MPQRENPRDEYALRARIRLIMLTPCRHKVVCVEPIRAQARNVRRIRHGCIEHVCHQYIADRIDGIESHDATKASADAGREKLLANIVAGNHITP